LGRPDLTAERFLTIPLDGQPQRIYRTGDLATYTSDGTLVFLGRTDQQLKIRGHRIEAGAVAAQLRAHPDVAEAAVIARPLAGRSGAQLVGYVVASGPGFDARAVSEALRRELPEHMVPDVLVAIDAIPRLPNGKLDVASLPDPRVGSDGPNPARDAARTPEEEILAGIWCDLLGLESVGVQDDFFSLGGDSLASIRMVSRVRQTLGVDLPLNTLLAHPTIESLGRVVDGQSDPEVERRCLVPIHTDGTRVPLIAIHGGSGFVLQYRALWERLGRDQPMYAIEPVGLDGGTEPLDSVPAMAARYVSELREVQPSGPYRLIGNCFGGVVALEMAGMLESAGEKVELITVVDGSLPLHPERPQPAIARAMTVLRKRGAVALLRKARARVMRSLAPQAASRPGGDRRPVDPHTAVRHAVFRAFDAYEPKPVAAPILLVRSSRHRTIGEGYSWHMGWGEYTESFEVTTVEGQREDMFRVPNVELLASILQAHIGAGHRG
jgi:thioesterase domain-containing protein/acyl carrier protein